jgi:Flp pilus assembly pilin Flp
MRLLKDKRAAELSEVGIVLALVVVVAIVALRALGINITDVLNTVSNAIGGR